MEKRPMAAGPCPGSGPIRILVSACLLGEKVRYDGGHKRDAFIADTLGRLVECVPVCPETECGLPTPREAMRLLRNAAGLRLVTVDTGVDHTGRMGAWARRKLKDLSRLELSGYICKEGSPSCGLERVPVFGAFGAPPHTAGGIFTRLFMERFPNVPVEEEGRLKDSVVRRKFLEKLFGPRRRSPRERAQG